MRILKTYCLLALVLFATGCEFIPGWGLDKALFKAADQGDVRKVKRLLKRGADVNARDKYGRTPLWYAFHYDPAIVGILLENGADVDARDEHGQTPLMNATNDTRIDIMQILLKAGANVNAADNYGRTALMYAVDPIFCFTDVYLDVVELVLKNGANINATDDRGATALLYVIKADCHRSDDMTYGYAKVLVENGIDVNISEKHGCTALDYVRTESELGQLLLGAGAVEGEGCLEEEKNLICT